MVTLHEIFVGRNYCRSAYVSYLYRCELAKNYIMGLPTKLEEFETAPFDPRFPNQNQTRYCWQSYVDYHRCQKVKGKDYEPCKYFKKVYHSMCPNAWVEKWDDQLANGTFPGRI
ncbi:Cytochrome c oxidase subunit 6B1 [Chamberlinius hualienensis]